MLGGFFFSYLKTEQVKWLSVDFFSSFPKHKTTTKARSCTSVVVLRLLFGSLKGINSITEMYNLNITRFTEKKTVFKKYFNAKKSQVLLNGLNKQKSITLCTAVIKNMMNRRVAFEMFDRDSVNRNDAKMLRCFA